MSNKRRVQVVIVDDDPSLRSLIREMLSSDELEVTDFSNALEAHQHCLSNDVGILITDLVMPQKTGLDLIMALKQTKPELHIIAISGGGGITGRFDYLPIASLLGVYRILRKPFDARQLTEAIDEIVCSIQTHSAPNKIPTTGTNK